MLSWVLKKLKRKALLYLITVLWLFIFLYISLFSNTLLQYIFYEKLWVHRVDSKEKLSEVEDKFYGVELDVVFIDSLNTFDITHPPEPSINLNLLDYLKSCKNNQLHFWIDFKNLNQLNEISALKRLNFICNQLQMDKNRFIVESPEPELLKEYELDGYLTSFYLPWPGLHQLKKDTLENMLIYLNKKVQKTNYISSNYHDYKIVEEHFPKANKLFWLTGGEKEFSSVIKERLFLYEILMNNKTKILLVEYDSRARNR